MEPMLDQHLLIGYSSTEIARRHDRRRRKVQRPPVIDYKLLDVPELGLFQHRQALSARRAAGEVGAIHGRLLQAPRPDRREVRRGRLATRPATSWPRSAPTGSLRRPAQQRHQAVAGRIRRRVPAGGALSSHSPLIRQIYIYGNSERSFLLAVVVPTDEAATQFEGDGPERQGAMIRESLQAVAGDSRAQRLRGAARLPHRDRAVQPRERPAVGSRQARCVPSSRNATARGWSRCTPRSPRSRSTSCAPCAPVGADRPVLDTVLRAAQATLGIVGRRYQHRRYGSSTSAGIRCRR